MRIPRVLINAAVGVAGIATYLMFAMPVDAARRKYCMTDHFHYGSSSGRASKKAAQAAATAAWADFTVFEYGSAWGSFKRARSKGISCERTNDGWGCRVEAVPCR